MSSESNRVSAASAAYVNAVCRAWGWSWMETTQADDDGIDGLAYLRAFQSDQTRASDRRGWKHASTGGLIYVQIKSGGSYVVKRANDFIEIFIDNVDVHRALWIKSALPVALVYVKEEFLGKVPSAGWWADLKASASYTSKGTVLVPLKNRFQPGLECRKPFSRLASGQHRRLDLNVVDMGLPGPLPSALKTIQMSSKQAAVGFYRQWSEAKPIHTWLGPITINRTGWTHITRTRRPVTRIQRSFDLLPAAARILSEIDTWRVLRRSPITRPFEDGSWAVYDYLGVSAICKWPARGSSEVIVILRRKTTLAPRQLYSTANMERVEVIDSKVWFYSVYEPGRNKLTV